MFFINNVYKIKQEESQKCRVEANLVGFLSISKKPGEYSRSLWNLDVLYDDGVVLVVVMMMVNILELYLHNSSCLLISTPLILETTLGDKCTIIYVLHLRS